MFARSLLALALACSSIVSSRVVRQEGTPFDGQYIQPNASNAAVEWWWGSATGAPVGNNPPPSFQFLFYQGYPVLFGPRDASLPEYYVVINGFFPNGTAFAGTIPATSGTITAVGQEVTGTWDGAGGFKGAPDLSTFTITLDAPDFGFVGSVKLTSRLPHHFACNNTDGPYFNSIVGAPDTLSATENLLFTQLGWAVAVPGAVAEVDMVINGAKLQFLGQGYHDANWAPVPLNEIVSTWFFGTASVGEYDLSFVSATPLGNSTKILNTGYLAKNGVVLQNQCSLQGTKTRDISAITLYGIDDDAVSGVTVPTGFIIDYVLADGEHYSFNLSSIGTAAQNPDQSIYHRWVGLASGGKVGEKPSKGETIFEWLNPGFVPYPQ